CLGLSALIVLVGGEEAPKPEEAPRPAGDFQPDPKYVLPSSRPWYALAALGGLVVVALGVMCVAALTNTSPPPQPRQVGNPVAPKPVDRRDFDIPKDKDAIPKDKDAHPKDGGNKEEGKKEPPRPPKPTFEWPPLPATVEIKPTDIKKPTSID